MGRFCDTQVECVLDSSKELDNFLATLQEIVRSSEVQDSLSDWNTLTIYGLEQDGNKVRWYSDGFGWYKSLLEILCEKYPRSKFAQLWLPCDTSCYSNWGIDIYYDGQEQVSTEQYSEDSTDDFEEIGFAFVDSDTETQEKYPRLCKFINLAKDKGFSFPKAEDFDCFADRVPDEPEREIITFETLCGILNFLEDNYGYDFSEIEMEFRISALLSEEPYVSEDFEFTPETFVKSTGMKWQPWSPIDNNVPATYITLLEENFPEENRIRAVQFNENGTILTLFYDETQEGLGLICQGGEHVATYNHETGEFFDLWNRNK